MPTLTVSKWGNSSAVRLPKIFGLNEGDKLSYHIEGDSIILEKTTAKKSTRQMIEEYYHMPYSEVLEKRLIENSSDEGELDWGPDVGGEVID